MADNALLNGGFALGGGLGSMPVAAPFSIGGLGIGALLQRDKLPGIFGAALPSGMREGMINSLPYITGALGGAGVGGAMAMQPKPEEAAQPTNTEYAPFGGDTKPSGTEYAPFGGDEAPAGASAQQPTPEAGTDAKNMEAYRMMARGIQGMNRQQAFPSGNTAQIIRDNNQFRFAGYQGTPQQQMANALRNRG